MSQIYTAPAVFLCEGNYQIVFDSITPGACFLEIGDLVLKESVGGIVRTDSRLHKFTLKRDLLDKAGAYTIRFQPFEERNPYFPKGGDEVTLSRVFRPLPDKLPLTMLVLGDVHSDFDHALQIANQAGEIDLPVFLGDLASCSCSYDDITTLLSLASTLSNGEKPVLAVRGNHELRGEYAWRLPEVLPCTEKGFYYPVDLDCLEFLVLDSGEDKNDSHEEYGILADYSAYRRAEADFLEDFADKAGKKRKPRLIFSHVPFPVPHTDGGGVFDIEPETFGRMVKACNKWHPDLQICGHLHVCGLRPAEKDDRYGRTYPILLASEFAGSLTVGTKLTVSDSAVHAELIGPDGTLRESYDFPIA